MRNCMEIGLPMLGFRCLARQQSCLCIKLPKNGTYESQIEELHGNWPSNVGVLVQRQSCFCMKLRRDGKSDQVQQTKTNR